MAQNRLLELPQLLARLEAEALGQFGARLAIGGERVRLTARPIQGEHELRAQPLPVRAVGDQRLELSDQLGVTAAGQVGVDALLRGRGAEFLQAGDLGLREGLIGHVRQRRPVPELERPTEPVRRDLRILPIRVGHKPLEAADIDLGGLRAEDIAGRLRDEPAVAQRLPKMRHVDLDAL